MTFAATANAVLMQGGTPVFADVEHDTLLLDVEDAERKCTKRTKAIIAVDFAGQPCDYSALHALCKKKNIPLVADACHALDARYKNIPVGTLADLTAFSFHAVKPLTTGEGGMITTQNPQWAATMRQFRHHNISVDPEERKRMGTWLYTIEELGYNYRLTDMQCALGRSQLKKVPAWTKRRQEIARRYDEALAHLTGVTPLHTHDHNENAYHLYVVQFDHTAFSEGRDTLFRALAAENIGVNLHYIPVHLHALYRRLLHTKPGDCPVAEEAYANMLSLPLFASMSDQDVIDVISAFQKVCTAYAV